MSGGGVLYVLSTGKAAKGGVGQAAKVEWDTAPAPLLLEKARWRRA